MYIADIIIRKDNETIQGYYSEVDEKGFIDGTPSHICNSYNVKVLEDKVLKFYNSKYMKVETNVSARIEIKKIISLDRGSNVIVVKKIQLGNF